MKKKWEGTVKIKGKGEGKANSQRDMVVPSLLPETASIPRDIFCFPEQWSSSCLFSFYTRHNYIESPFYTVDDLRQGFLPVGLFERLVCKLLRFVNEQVYHNQLNADNIVQDEWMLTILANQC